MPSTYKMEPTFKCGGATELLHIVVNHGLDRFPMAPDLSHLACLLFAA